MNGKLLIGKKFILEFGEYKTKIYDCSLKDDKLQVINLQKILSNLIETKLLAVRKVTQDNRGKKTAGVDGVKFLSPSKRICLAS